ncbi:cholinesterase 1-like [Oppia nitens]|uniref:cholinesterase 1-like n=1 Tax=Oppia nitens TaxID=1686743 RepID=UPI0023DB2D9F|nr:cholinesterase 1-like [Oppia nitens]
MLKQYLLNNINLFIIKICLVIISILVKYDCFGQQNNKRYVSTTSGIVEGHELEGLDVNEYLGIPYAEPPVGDLRFARPVPLSIRKNVTIGLKDRSEGVWCIQNASPLFKAELGPIPESEDCLHLNIWSPKQFHLYDGRPYNKLKSVIVVFHSGGFSTGSAYMETANGSQMATRDVIVVSPNYRLGPLGFYMLDPGDDSAPGNVAFYDQLLALRWIQDNIRSFGGDPNLVTIFGESAGSLSVSAHIISPVSRGLFKRAIMSSGALIYSKISPTLNTSQALVMARKMATKNGCPENGSIVQCLRKINDTNKLLNIPDKLFDYSFTRPVEGTEFIPHLTNQAFKYSLFNPDIDVLAGTVDDEGPAMALIMFPEITEKNMTLDLYNQLLVKLKAKYHIKDMESISKHYMIGIDSDDPKQLQRGFVNLLGDMMITCPTYTFAKQLAINGENVFYFLFKYENYKNSYVNMSNSFGIGKRGAQHGSDGDFFIGKPLIDKQLYNNEEEYFSRKLLYLLTAFVKYGRPNNNWPRLMLPINLNNDIQIKLLNINDTVTILKSPYNETCENVWKDYYM